MKKRLVLMLIAGLGLTPGSWAEDGIAVGLGHGDATNMGQISLTRQWDSKWFNEGNWYLSGYWEVSVGRWRSSETGSKNVWDIGFAPVFRLQSKAESGWRPYVEGAIGFHLISNTHVDSLRDMSSAFQFGDHLGAGLLLGEKGQFDLGYRFQHLSNAGIKLPNDGIDFQQIRLSYQF